MQLLYAFLSQQDEDFARLAGCSIVRLEDREVTVLILPEKRESFIYEDSEGYHIHIITEKAYNLYFHEDSAVKSAWRMSYPEPVRGQRVSFRAVLDSLKVNSSTFITEMAPYSQALVKMLDNEPVTRDVAANALALFSERVNKSFTLDNVEVVFA